MACFLGRLCSRDQFLAKISFFTLFICPNNLFRRTSISRSVPRQILVVQKAFLLTWQSLQRSCLIPKGTSRVLSRFLASTIERWYNSLLLHGMQVKHVISLTSEYLQFHEQLCIDRWTQCQNQAVLLFYNRGSGTRYWPLHRCHLSSTSLLISLSQQPHWHVTLIICVSTIQLRPMYGQAVSWDQFHRPWSTEHEIHQWYEQLVITPEIVHDQTRLQRQQLRFVFLVNLVKTLLFSSIMLRVQLNIRWLFQFS